MAKNVFERLEKKYIVSLTQKEKLLASIGEKIQNDRFASYTVSNLYYDTEQYDLIRKSTEKPIYKEKLRLRSYGQVTPETPVFLELKKRFKGVVYKRRVKLPYEQAVAFVQTGEIPGEITQIKKELQYFISRQPLAAKVMLLYERQAFEGVEDAGLRMTFDRDIRFRQSEIGLDQDGWGIPILAPDREILEIKFLGAMPVWLSHALSALGVFPASFSKYGTCYQKHIMPGLRRKKEEKISA